MAYTPEGSQFLENLLADMSDRRLFALFVGERPHTLFAACARMLIPPRVVLDRFDSRWEEGPMLVDDKGQEHMYVVRIHPYPLVEVGPSAGTVTKAVGGHLILVRVEMREALRLLAYKETISQLGECRKQILKEFWAGAEESLGAKLVSDDLARFHFRGFTTQALSLVAERATNQVQLNAFGETVPFAPSYRMSRSHNERVPSLTPTRRLASGNGVTPIRGPETGSPHTFGDRTFMNNGAFKPVSPLMLKARCGALEARQILASGVTKVR